MDPVSESVGAAVGDLDRQTRLARSTRPGQGHQPTRAQQLHQLSTLALAPHKTGDLRRHVVCSRVQGAQRWEVSRYARRNQLEQPLRVLEVLQPVLTEIAQCGSQRQGRCGQCTGSVRQHYLSTVAGVGDPRCAMRVEPDVVPVQQPPLPTVNAHPYAHHRIRRPPVFRQPALPVECCAHCGRRIDEHIEQRIPLRAHLHTGRAERFAQ